MANLVRRFFPGFQLLNDAYTAFRMALAEMGALKASTDLTGLLGTNGEAIYS
jgi:hypothetical protein